MAQTEQEHRVILWLRNDLRVHDNPVLDWAVRNARPGTQVLPVFCFDPRFFTKAVPEFRMARKAGAIRVVRMARTVRVAYTARAACLACAA